MVDKKKILVLVEGEKTDLQLMERLFNLYEIDMQYQIVPYKTNIYVLYNEMFKDGNPDDMDILAHLKEHEKDQKKKALFDERFSDILLVFDLDPQDPQFSVEIIVEMSEYFVESTDMGKLYINYPMVEAFYHMKSIPDADYNNYFASMAELKSGSYKSRVNAENRDHDYSKFPADKAECSIVIKQNVEKAWLVAETRRHSTDIDCPPPEQISILNGQLIKIRSENVVAILCTCVFFIVEYNPKLLF